MEITKEMQAHIKHAVRTALRHSGDKPSMWAVAGPPTEIREYLHCVADQVPKLGSARCPRGYVYHVTFHVQGPYRDFSRCPPKQQKGS